MERRLLVRSVRELHLLRACAPRWVVLPVAARRCTGSRLPEVQRGTHRIHGRRAFVDDLHRLAIVVLGDGDVAAAPPPPPPAASPSTTASAVHPAKAAEWPAKLCSSPATMRALPTRVGNFYGISGISDEAVSARPRRQRVLAPRSGERRAQQSPSRRQRSQRPEQCGSSSLGGFGGVDQAQSRGGASSHRARQRCARREGRAPSQLIRMGCRHLQATLSCSYTLQGRCWPPLGSTQAAALARARRERVEPPRHHQMANASQASTAFPSLNTALARPQACAAPRRTSGAPCWSRCRARWRWCWTTTATRRCRCQRETGPGQCVWLVAACGPASLR